MMRLGEAAEAMNAVLSGVDCLFTGVGTDSRSSRHGELFVAIAGERFDGHHFIEAARRSGAVAALVDHAADVSDIDPAFPLLKVRDTTEALGLLATNWRQRFTVPVLGITGSNGKTTVTAMVRQVLSVSHQPLAPRHSFNNQWGVPLTLLDLHPGHTHAVIEMGMNHRGEIDYLTRIAQPTAALINNAAAAHLEGLGSVREVALAKAEIINGMTADGVLIVNADDKYVDLWRQLSGDHPVQTFGLENDSDVTASDVVHETDSLTCALRIGDETRQLRLPVPGSHNLYNALATATICHVSGISIDQIVAGLKSFESVAGRLRKLRSAGGAVLIDDSFNANPASTRAAIDVLANQKGRSILVLGAMAELGDEAPILHQQVGEYASAAGVEQLLVLADSGNPAVGAYADGFGPGASVFAELDQLLSVLAKEDCGEVAILVKGSKSSTMGRVVDALKDGSYLKINNNSTAEATC